MSDPNRKDKKSAAFKVLAVIMIFVLLSTNTATIYILWKTGIAFKETAEAKPVIVTQIVEPVESEEEMLPAMSVSKFMELARASRIPMDFLQKFFSDRIIIWHSDELHSVAVDRTLKQSDFNNDHIVYNQDGTRSYCPDGEEDISLLGIDVSNYQGDINWKKVKAAGIDYAIVRLGYRGYSTGTIKIDTKYHINMTSAAAEGVPTGVYFYSQAINEAEAIEEAEMVIENLKAYDIKYPVVFDMEEVNDDPQDVRTSRLTPKERTDITIAFCERIKKAGYTPMVYGNISWLILNLEFERLEEYDKWFAQYFKQPFFPYEFSMWQYSCKGTVNGIRGEVDLNMGLVDYSKTS